MDTLFVLLKDTIASSDTIVVKMVKAAEACQPIVKEAETNCFDFAIMVCVCAAIAAVIIIGICKFFADKKDERESQKGKESQKHNWEEAEKERKKEAEETSRTWQHEDQERKLKTELLNKYLDFLKEQAEAKDDEIKSTQYRQVLEYMIELSQNGKLNEFSETKLNTIFNTPKG